MNSKQKQANKTKLKLILVKHLTKTQAQNK